MSASPLGSVDKALQALDALARAGAGGAPLAALATEVEVNKTTLHRTLAALRHRGYAEQAPDGAYRLGPAALALGSAFLQEENLPQLLRPALTAVSAEVDELVHLGALAGREIVYLDKVEPQRAVRVWSAVGRHRPAATTALGRAWLAATEATTGPFDDAALARLAAGDCSPADLRRALDTAHRQGYAQEDEENEPGIACVAVAVLRQGRPVAAVSVTAPVERMAGDSRAPRVAALLRSLPALLPAGLSVAAPQAGGAR
ncbi:IclR family transcriptional regulator [Xylanimonas oleitrophica]|uniref:IclR family transcriptional regulator n=1 Tax=Xylanimonas oleitrophica TaxID=2607479 RepID=A0A2W5YIU1_9MICO|nr:IclR family transcriptional regulator [Xylanimonas oleitrophica]PZR55021.1 IclR family transcriptional regulator [Xylanimonas oleitrophica]